MVTLLENCLISGLMDEQTDCKKEENKREDSVIEIHAKKIYYDGMKRCKGFSKLKLDNHHDAYSTKAHEYILDNCDNLDDATEYLKCVSLVFKTFYATASRSLSAM